MAKMKDDGFGFLYKYDPQLIFELGRGLLLGDDSGFSWDFQATVRQVGVSHLTAASGANLGFLERVLGLLGLHRWRWAFVVFSVAAVAGYVEISGWSGSLWRAVWMWLLLRLGQVVGWKIPSGWQLGVVIGVTSVVRPEYLHSAGFWLSWLAVLVMVFSQRYKKSENYFFFLPQRDRILEKTKQSLFIGCLIFGFVSLWLFPLYRSFQPIGIVGTWLLGSLTEPYAASMLTWLLVQDYEVSGMVQLVLSGLFVGFVVVLESLLWVDAHRWISWGLILWLGSIVAGRLVRSHQLARREKQLEQWWLYPSVSA